MNKWTKVVIGAVGALATYLISANIQLPPWAAPLLMVLSQVPHMIDDKSAAKS